MGQLVDSTDVFTCHQDKNSVKYIGITLLIPAQSATNFLPCGWLYISGLSVRQIC